MTPENHRDVCLPVGRGTACKPLLKAGRECKPSSRLLAAWGRQITACSLGACGFGWSVDMESHSWETDANVCLCSWHFLIRTVSVEEIFLAAEVWQRPGSCCEVPRALQGDVGLFQLGPATSLWSPAGTKARTSPSSYSFSELCSEDRGLWKRTVASACFISPGLATGTLRTVSGHRMEVASRPGCSRLLDRDAGGPYGILHWLLDPERHCTGIVSVFFS